jgi:dTMP kinase
MALFISIEGPDGSGKSTQARLLAKALRDSGFSVLETREPGGTPLGERLRPLILDPESPPATPMAMALMYSAARAQLVADVIEPALAAGQIVIVDRYADSTAAYQGGGQGLNRGTIDALRRAATGGREPDVTVYVDIDPEAGAERMAARGPHDRLDAETVAFHRRVRAEYQRLLSENPDRWISVCGAAAPDVVHREIMDKLLPRLDPKGTE